MSILAAARSSRALRYGRSAPGRSKAQLYADLRKPRLAEGAETEPPGTCHHGRWLEENYFTQITAEYLTDENFRGRQRKIWKQRGPNHFLDCRIYNLALADYVGLSRMTSDEWAQLGKLRGVPDEFNRSDLSAPDSAKLAAVAAAADEIAQAPSPQVAKAPPRRYVRRAMRSSFMDW